MTIGHPNLARAFEHKPVALGAALLCAGAAALITAQTASAAPPSGCEVGQFFTQSSNSVAGTFTSAGTSLAAAEASTSQVLELTARRRVEKEKSETCPVGSARVNGVCQPTRRTDSTSQPAGQGARDATRRTTSIKTPGRPSAEAAERSLAERRPTVQKLTEKDVAPTRRSLVESPMLADAQASVLVTEAALSARLEPTKSVARRETEAMFAFAKAPEPIVHPSRNAVWLETFADYELRTGLVVGPSRASRSQLAAGLAVGADHSLQVDDLGMLFGVFGAATDIRQDFERSATQQLDTNFKIDLSGSGTRPFPPGSVFDYVFPVEHSLESLQTQTLKGPSLGLTSSFFKGGFFSDAVVKSDFFDLSRQTTISDTFPRTLHASFNNVTGCINVAIFPPPPAYTISGPQTSTTAISQKTSAINLIYAQDFGYHLDLPQGSWLEPLVGGQFTYSTYGSNAADLGLENGNAFRVLGGARLGVTRQAPGAYRWTSWLTALLYSDVAVRGFVTNADGFSAGYLAADQGKLRFQGILATRVDLLNGFSGFAELQTRSGQDYAAVGGRIGARYEWPVSGIATVPLSSPAMSVPPPLVVPSWTSFYVGGNIGYGWGDARTDLGVSGTTTAPTFIVEPTLDPLAPNSAPSPFNFAFTDSNTAGLNGVVGGGQLGYNYQLNRSWVVGVEADIQGSGERGSKTFVSQSSASTCAFVNVNFFGTCTQTVPLSGLAVTNYDAKIGWFGTLRGRAGISLTDQILLYGTGGLAYGAVELSGNIPAILFTNSPTLISASLIPTSAAFNRSAINLGFAVGGGIESKFSFWLENWTWKLEYLYLDLGSIAAATSSTATAAPGELSFATDTRFTDNIVRVGLNYGF